jgi:zinc transport system permease protein
LSASIGLAGILSHYATKANFDSYLFGSIILIGETELILTIILTALVILFSFLFYPHMFALLYSEKEAKVNGVKVNLLNFFHSLLLSITIAVGAKVVGSLVVSSMIVLPTAIALLLKKGYKSTLFLSILFSLIAMIGGLTISYYLEWAPGATIVMTTIALLVLVLLYRGILVLTAKQKEKQK